jgi:hypothetical protein
MAPHQENLPHLRIRWDGKQAHGQVRTVIAQTNILAHAHANSVMWNATQTAGEKAPTASIDT